MKKKLLALLATVAVACLVLVGCGGKAADPKAAFVGTWELSGMVESGQETSSADIEMLKGMGLEVKLVLSEDGKGALSLFGEDMSGTWEASSAEKGTFTYEGQSVNMTIANDTLSMDQNGSTLSFKKAAAASTTSAAETTSAAAGSAAEATSAQATSAEATSAEATSAAA